MQTETQSVKLNSSSLRNAARIWRLSLPPYNRVSNIKSKSSLIQKESIKLSYLQLKQTQRRQSTTKQLLSKSSRIRKFSSPKPKKRKIPRRLHQASCTIAPTCSTNNMTMRANVSSPRLRVLRLMKLMALLPSLLL